MINSKKKHSIFVYSALVTSILLLSSCSNVSTQESNFVTETSSPDKEIDTPAITSDNTDKDNNTDKDQLINDYPLHSVIRFEFDSYRLTEEAKTVLDEIVQQIAKDNITSINIALDGHTDAIGTMDYNEQLSLQRAQATEDYLAKSIDKNKITWDLDAYGETQPTASNATDKGQSLNRRVELHISLVKKIAGS